MKEGNNFRVYLRALEPEDYKTTIKWHNDEEIWSNVGSLKRYVSAEYEKKWINDVIFNTKHLKLGVCLKDNNMLIGLVSLTNINNNNRSCESNTMIGNANYRGRGLAKEAKLLILSYAFNELNMHRITALIIEENIPSIHLYKSCGFKKDGVLRESVYKQGAYRNQVIMSILKQDYIKLIEQDKYMFQKKDL